MAAIRESLSDFIPSLPSMANISSRLSKSAGEEPPNAYKYILGQIATNKIRTAIYEAGIQRKSGRLLDSVKYDFSAGEWGEIAVDVPYATALEYGRDMKNDMMGRTVPMQTSEGTIFRKITANPTITGKNWIIQAYKYFETAKLNTNADTDVVKIVEELNKLITAPGPEELRVPTEELSESDIRVLKELAEEVDTEEIEKESYGAIAELMIELDVMEQDETDMVELLNLADIVVDVGFLKELQEIGLGGGL